MSSYFHIIKLLLFKRTNNGLTSTFGYLVSFGGKSDTKLSNIITTAKQ